MPNKYQTRMMLAHSLIKLKQEKKASKNYAKLALQERPDSEQAQLIYAKILVSRLEYKEAISILTEMYDKKQVWILLGQASEQAKDFKKAEKAYLRCLSLDPLNLPASMHLAYLYYHVGEGQKSHDMFKELSDQSKCLANIAFGHAQTLLKYRNSIKDIDSKECMKKAVDNFK